MISCSAPGPSRKLAALAFLVVILAAPMVALAAVQDEILAQVISIRGLEQKAEVPFAFVDAAQLRNDLLHSYNDEQAVREIEISRKLIVMLGLLSPDADLHGTLVDLYAENILGYYNHKDKKMYLVSGKTTFGPVEKITLAHEFTHALQDQYFDLEKLQQGPEDNSDRSLAVTSLIEGDATLTMVIWARRFLSQDELIQLQASSGPTSLDTAPLVVRDEALFPYNEGALFVFQLWRTGGFQAVNSAFRDPPQSSEQIMHPEKYLAREKPVEVTLPDLAAALGPGWTQLRSDVLGEIDMRILLEQFLGADVAAKGAEGWGGDRFSLLENEKGQNALVVGTVWDSEAEAGEFFNDYVDTVARRYGNRARRTEDVPSKIVWSTPNGSQLLQKWGPRVAIIMAPDDDVLKKLQQAIAPAAAQPSAPPAEPTPTPTPGPQPAPVQVPR